ncbi:CCAAT-binding factor complex subunit HapE [Coccidioides posadasii str. Silveira]|uniref:CCAAT-binding factor complex subunit HapE n=1 Tax=Coccidioides posadasii (strain RMSCC 757 / Silveira) TaxID=443226 RepID=E9CS09_COCPS|nr:CCAAT-binding factor complex subunit HapE [Coccidioides posadasii str. Silveira]
MEPAQAGAAGGAGAQSAASRQRHHHHQPQDTQGQGGQQGGQQQQQPVYDIRNGGHYGAIKGASAALSAQGYAPVPELYTGTWANVNQGLTGQARDVLTTYWQHMINHLESDNHDYKIHQLPLARIKKVMKADPEVKMISAEAPILFAKGCDIFITELTMRAWIHAEDNKRRTLQRSDIAAALAKSDMFDFLIDIVPREEATSHTKRSAPSAPPQHANAGQMPPQQPGVQQPHHMGPPDYGSLGQPPMGQEQDYRQQPAMYGGAVQSDPAYGQPQPQMFEGMYGYSHLPTQQVLTIKLVGVCGRKGDIKSENRNMEFGQIIFWRSFTILNRAYDCIPPPVN